MASETISTVLVPAPSLDLVDLATVKDELQLADTTNDTWLTRAIQQISRAIRNYCNRDFAIETVQDLIYPARGSYVYKATGDIPALQLSHWPIVSSPLTLPTTSAAIAGGAVLAFADATGVAIGQPVAGATIPPGAVVTAIAGGNVTLSKPLAAALPAGSLVTFGLAVAITDPPGVLTWLTADQDFRIDAAPAQLVRLGLYDGQPMIWKPVPTVAVYQAGFATVPEDIADAALRAISARFASRGRDPLLRSQDQPGLGTQHYWVGTVPGIRGAFTEEVADLLDNYRVDVAA